jgi:hypothetical protein
MGEVARRTLDLAKGPLARVNWAVVDRQLRGLAEVSGGRAYTRVNAIDTASIYDEMMEDLRVRNVLRYAPIPSTPPGMPRHVQVRLVDRPRAESVRVPPASRRDVGFSVITEATYIPSAAAIPAGYFEPFTRRTPWRSTGLVPQFSSTIELVFLSAVILVA